MVNTKSDMGRTSVGQLVTVMSVRIKMEIKFILIDVGVSVSVFAFGITWLIVRRRRRLLADTAVDVV